MNVDVSCGFGHLLKFLKERGFEGDYLGIGLQEEMVARAHRRYPEAGFEAADFLEDKLEFEEHDFVLVSGVLQHRESPLRKRFISRMYEL